METRAWAVEFKNCNSSKTSQQWVIWKTENDGDYVRICQKEVKYEEPYSSDSHTTPNCLQASSKMWDIDRRHQQVASPFQKKARNVSCPPEDKRNLSQKWIINNTTNQLINAKYPEFCMTTRSYLKTPGTSLLLECKDNESPNPQLPKHQRFSQIPCLDKNGNPLCFD